MDLNNVLSTSIIFARGVPVVLAVRSYMSVRLRERRRPREALDSSKENIYFERFVLNRTSGQSGQPL